MLMLGILNVCIELVNYTPQAITRKTVCIALITMHGTGIIFNLNPLL